MKIKPITPADFDKAKPAIPAEVINAWNDLIMQQAGKPYVTILQKDAASFIALAMNVTRDVVFERGWLDIEGIYRKAGWKVDYDKPAYNETYEASFVFRK